MTCEEINSRLIELVYGELEPAVAARCREHAVECAACGAELAALEQTQQVLDAMPPRETRVDLARLCLKSAQRQQHVRGRALWAGAGAAAAMLVATGLLAAGLLTAALRVEVAPGQVVLAWRSASDGLAGEEAPDRLMERPKIPRAVREEPARATDERLARTASSEVAASATPSESFSRYRHAWSQEPTYLATRDRVLALGLDSLQYTAARPAAARRETKAPATYNELRQELLDHNERVPPRM